MSNELRRITVSIAGEQYTLLADEPQNDIMEAVYRVDTEIRCLQSRMSSVDIKQLTTLVALRLALEIQHSTKVISDHQLRIESLTQNIVDAL